MLQALESRKSALASLNEKIRALQRLIPDATAGKDAEDLGAFHEQLQELCKVCSICKHVDIKKNLQILCTNKPLGSYHGDMHIAKIIKKQWDLNSKLLKRMYVLNF